MMESKNIKELSIRSPKRYKIALAIAKGLNQGKQMKDVFAALGINPNTGYSVATQLKSYIAEMRQLQAGPDEKTSRKLLAKKLLDDATPEAAQELINLMRDDETPKREKRQACKDILDISGIRETTPEPPDVHRKMQNIMLNIFYPESREEKPVTDVENKMENPETDLKLPHQTNEDGPQ